MIYIASFLTYAGISMVNLKMEKNRNVKASSKIKDNLGKLGYSINDKNEKNICDNVVKASDEKFYEDCKMGMYGLSFIPLLNVATLFENITNKKDFLHSYYDFGIENSSNFEILDKLKEKNIVYITEPKFDSVNKNENSNETKEYNHYDNVIEMKPKVRKKTR